MIILSSFTGAALLVQAFELNRSWEAVLIAILFIIGLAIQAGIRRREQSRIVQARDHVPSATPKGVDK